MSYVMAVSDWLESRSVEMRIITTIKYHSSFLNPPIEGQNIYLVVIRIATWLVTWSLNRMTTVLVRDR